MTDPVGISLEEIRDFILSRGGKVTNHELVKHFKEALTNHNTRDEARILFKELINTVATITKDNDGNKQLVLKKKYRTPETPSKATPTKSSASGNQGYTSSMVLPALSLSPEVPFNLHYTPVYQTTHDTSPIGDTLGSPLALKGAPFTSDSPISSSLNSRRASQESLRSQLSLKSALSAVTSPTSMYSVSSSAPSINSGHTTSSTPSNTSSSATSTTSSSYTSSDRSSKAPTSSSSIIHRQLSDESMYSAVSEISCRSSSSAHSIKDTADSPPPPVPPRRKSSDKIRLELRESNEEIKPPSMGSLVGITSEGTSSITPAPSADVDNKENVANVSKISVKERSQKFDRMASESALNKVSLPNNANGNSNKKKHDKTDKDDEDSGSVHLMDGKTREWLVRCAQGDYQAIVKLAAENPKLVKFKDPTSTALHWGAKHGNLDLIKLIAGTHKADVNSRTNERKQACCNDEIFDFVQPCALHC
ncbi:uncharacterized protein isoform X2 [Rhodnius prolixus]|uniref:uncharacterized protein isoform X2 n=1 Tax=Rhodnius prolixus TaxID=13249 RepID=UPI003D18CEAA